MEKEKIYKIIILVYVLIILLIGFWPLKDLITAKSKAPSKFEVLNTSVLDSSTKALDKRNYSYNQNVNSIDINNFTFGNPNPFR